MATGNCCDLYLFAAAMGGLGDVFAVEVLVYGSNRYLHAFWSGCEGRVGGDSHGIFYSIGFNLVLG